MAKTCDVWAKVVDCAVSNSFHRNNGKNFSINEHEQECICRYIQLRGQKSEEESKAVIAESISRAREQVVADGKNPTWAKVGLIIGLLGIGFNLFNIIFVGFSFIFLVFLFAAALIISPCFKCINEQKNVAAAAKLWNESCRAGKLEEMDIALQKMEAMLASK